MTMTHPMGEKTYEYGADEPFKLARTITPQSERNADEVFAQASRLGPLPTGYIVKADVRCNQLDTFRMIACDFSVTIEKRSEVIQDYARAALANHFRHAHPYLDKAQRTLLIRAISFNFRDIGR